MYENYMRGNAFVTGNRGGDVKGWVRGQKGG